MNHLHYFGKSLFISAIVILPNCKPPVAKEPEVAKASVSVPTFSPVTEGTETQDRGGMVVQLAPPAFEVVNDSKTTCAQQQALIVQNNQYPYEIKTEPSFAVSPQNIEFNLKFTNHTQKILKLGGTDFKFVVSDKEVALDGSQLKSITDATLRPNDTKEFRILGPAWSTVPKDATVGLSIFNVPTEADDAGNVKKTENFDWTFNYRLSEVQKEGKITYESVNMTADEARNRCGST